MLTIELPIYGGMIVYVTDVGEYAEISAHYEEKEINDVGFTEGMFGVTSVVCRVGCAPIYIIGHFDGSRRTLVHELGHACLCICEHRGFSAHDGNGEPFCYLLDWLFATIESNIR